MWTQHKNNIFMPNKCLIDITEHSQNNGYETVLMKKSEGNFELSLSIWWYRYAKLKRTCLVSAGFISIFRTIIQFPQTRSSVTGKQCFKIVLLACDW